MVLAKGLGELLPGFLLDILAFGGQNNTPTGSIAVPTQDGTTAYYSNSFPLRRGMTFGWEIQLSGATPNVKVELEQGNQRPNAELAADSAWCIPDNKTTAMFPAISNTNVHQTAYAPNSTGFGRLKITGGTSNGANVMVIVARQYAIKNV